MMAGGAAVGAGEVLLPAPPQPGTVQSPPAGDAPEPASAATTTTRSGRRSEERVITTLGGDATSRHRPPPASMSQPAPPARTPTSPAAHLPPAPATTSFRWRKGEAIGRGAVGSVYLGLNDDTGALMAVKEVRLPPGSAASPRYGAHVAALQTEIDVLR